MTHEIESIAWVGERPWHGLGTEVLHLMTSQEAIALAGLDWEVDLKEVFHRTDGRFTLIPDKLAVVRNTDQKALGVVGPRYQPVQNSQAFTFFDSLIGSQAVYETAGSLRGGKIVWMMVKVPGQFKVGKKDVYDQYLTLTNGHDGNWPVRVVLSSVRVVCMNTLNMALSNTIQSMSIKHTGDIKSKVLTAQKVFGAALEYFKEMKEVMDYLLTKRITEQQTVEYVKSLFPSQKKEVQSETLLDGVIAASEPSSSLDDVIKRTRTDAYIEKIIELTESGKGTNLPGIKGSLYGAFQAVTEFSDHYAPYRGALDKKLDSNWFGASADLKQRAYNSAVQIAGQV